MIRSVVLAFLLTAIAFMSLAHAKDDARINLRAISLGKARPFAILSAQGAFGRPSETLSFYVYWDKPYGVAGRKRGFAARRSDSANGLEPVVTWAMSKTCPSLEPLLVQMESIPLPTLDTPTIGRERLLPPYAADGVVYQLWSRSPRWDGSSTAAYDVQLSSNVGTPLAAWAEAVSNGLAECWSSDEPTAG